MSAVRAASGRVLSVDEDAGGRDECGGGAVGGDGRRISDTRWVDVLPFQYTPVTQIAADTATGHSHSHW